MAWHDSEDAIGDLMRCKCPKLAGGSLDVAKKLNVDWWKERGIKELAFDTPPRSKSDVCCSVTSQGVVSAETNEDPS